MKKIHLLLSYMLKLVFLKALTFQSNCNEKQYYSLFLLFHIVSFSQTSVLKDKGSSLTLTNNFKLTDNFSVSNVTQLRTVFFIQNKQAFLIQLGISYKLNKNICVSAGYLLFTNYPNGRLHAPVKKYENRIWQNVIVNSTLGNSKLSQRFMYEQRF